MKKLREYRAKRQFESTPEPPAKIAKSKQTQLIFVIHKHAASRLHYDLRLEVQGVLKSWAVPKGPSLNSAHKRLAVMVEDHPFDYRTFEGNIPQGQYGGGSVMVWDEGTYEIPHAKTKKEAEEKVDEGLKKGHLEFIFHGKKLQGKFALIKTQLSEKQNAWLLIKIKDQFESKNDVTQLDKSVKTFRTMDEIKNEDNPSSLPRLSEIKKKEEIPNIITPMLAFLIKEPFDKKGWLFEIKWDGYRAITKIQNHEVKILSRNQESFNTRFPKLVKDMQKMELDSAVLDGEIVVVDSMGRSQFQLMQNYQNTQKGNLLYYVFDLLFLNGQDLRNFPLVRRKELLKQVIEKARSESIRYSDHIEERGISFFKEVSKNHLEGVMCKNGQSPYLMRRSREWLKVKCKMRQEVVIGGFTQPRGSRKKFGSLLVGIYQDGALIYAGHVGGGFSVKLLSEVYQRLEPLIIENCPFRNAPKPNTKATWVAPKLVCEVDFAEWTDEGIMRQPIFQGLRIDKKPKSVKRETF